MSFYICHCGNKEDSHNFKHPFEKIAKIIENGNSYTINASDFPVRKKTKCKVEQCNGTKLMHNGTLIIHPYEPEEYSYRAINFSVPNTTECLVCERYLGEHSDGFMTHHFKTSVVINNNLPKDEIKIYNREDEDVKIIWN